MSKTKDILVEREKELLAALKELEPLQKELVEVQKALKALNSPDKDTGPACGWCSYGCADCRCGERHR